MIVLQSAHENEVSIKNDWEKRSWIECNFGSSPERETTDTIFEVKQLQEKFDKDKEVWKAFVDLEMKAFYIIKRQVLWWYLRKMKVVNSVDYDHYVSVWLYNNFYDFIKIYNATREKSWSERWFISGIRL